MIRRGFIRNYLIVVSVCSQIAYEQDNLQPEQGTLNAPIAAVLFDQSLRNSLLKNAPHYYRARIVCLPSWEPPWVLSLVCEHTDQEDESQPVFFLEYATLEDRDNIPIEHLNPIITSHVVFDRNLGESIQEVWLRMLRQVRYSGKPMGGGADGTSYHFSRFVPLPQRDPKAPPGWEAGWVWSPEPHSCTGQLVELAEALREYAVAPNEKRCHISECLKSKIKKMDEALDQRERMEN